MGQYQVGLIGLAVMGANLARNIREHRLGVLSAVLTRGM